ncbi:uncharacterized protein LOC100210120 isoform X1 [Hydra vulgaris]|uniref:uncharacterized protein LOC100210120 isoform X1 n=1 Tax=Hydra vulgaris TaxID=6087 RepID=UPI0032E9ECBE
MKNEWLQRLLQTFLFIFILKGFSLSKKCNFPVDIVFVLDGSERISSEFSNQIGYVISIIEAAGGISKTGLHASVVIVEANPKIQIPLNAHDNTLSFENNLYKLEHTYESSRIDASLLEAENSFITGSRKGALPVLILLTDGHHHDSYTYPTTVMKRLMLKGIIPYIVVVGTDFNMNNLENLIGKDSNDLQNKEVQHIFQPHEQISFNADISHSICNSFIWKMGEKLSKFKIGFVVDRTAGFKDSEKYLENQVNFVKYIYTKFAFEKQDLFSYGFYDGNSRFNKYFSEFQKNSFLQIHHDNFKELLGSVHKSFLGQTNDDLKKILVIFWGSLDKETVKDELDAFKSAGIVVFIITTLDGPSKEAMIFNGGKLFNQVNDANTRMEVVGKIYDGILARTNLFDTNECKSVIDLMFLVDTSGSMSKHYIDLLKVLKRIVAEFQISQHGSHAAVLSFNSYGSSVINFNKYFDNGMFNQALDEIPGPKGLIDMNAALTEVLNKLIKSNESRSLVAKVLFIFTDGFQVGGSFEKIVDQISNLGVKIFVIAYDGDINYATINKLLREPNNFFQISKDTEFLTESIAEKACNQAALYSDGFSKAFDIFFIFDGSLGTVQKDLAIMFVKLFKSEVKFGAMVSQNSSYVPFTFADTFTNKEYINAINDIELRAGNSDLLLAMRESRLNFFRKGFGARADVPKVLIIFTNTIMDNDQDITSETIEFKKVDISILVLGLGQNLDYKKMRLLGADNVFILSDTDEKSKENLVENLSKKVMYAPLSTILSKTLYDTQWIDVFGEFKENYDKSFSAVIPDVLESVWHFGPARIWKRPIHRSKYVIESKIQPTGELGFGSCGHIFKYKLDSTSSIKSVSKSWGYFLWVNQFLYISSDGSETSPRLLYSYKNAEWLHLRTVVDNSKVKIYINDVFIKEIIMTGEGHDSQINNYVGLWCHRMTNTVVKDFVVSNLVDQCSIQNGGCDHICNSSPYEYLCSCKVGYRLNIDERSCVNNVNESYSSITTVSNILQNQTVKSDTLQTTPYSLTSESITRDSNLLSGDSDLPLINSHNSFTSVVTTSSDFTLNKEVLDFTDSVSSKIFNVGFLFDDSSNENDQIQKDLCKEIIAKLSTNFYRYGIMISSTIMSVPLNISDSQNSQTLSELIDNLNLPETESQVDQTMKLASLLFPSKGISNTLIVFMDDKQQNEKEGVIKESQTLNAMAIEVVIIGIEAVPDKDSLHIKISTEEVVTKLAMKVNASSQVSATSIVNPTFAIITVKPNLSLDNITTADLTIEKSTKAPIHSDSNSLLSSKLLLTHSTENKINILSSMPAFNGKSSTMNPTTNIVDVTNLEPIISDSTDASVVSENNKIISSQLDTTQATEGETDIHSSIVSGKEDIAETTLLPDLTSESSTFNPTTNIVDVTNAEPVISKSTDASLKPGSNSLSGSQLHTTQGTVDKTDIYISSISEKDNIAETTLLPDFTGEYLSLNPTTNIVEVTNTKPIISDSTVASIVTESNKIISSQLDTTQATEGETDIHSSIISVKKDIAKTTLLPDLTSESSNFNPTSNIVDVTKAEPIISDSTDASLKPDSDSLSGSQLHTTQGTEDKTDIYISSISEKDNIAETTLLPDFTGESLSLNPTTNIVEGTDAEPIISDSTVASVVSDSNKIISSQLDTTQATEGETDIHSLIISEKEGIAKTTLFTDLTSESSTLNPTTNLVDVTKTEPIVSDSTDASLKPGSDSLSGSQLHSTQGTEGITDIYISIISEKNNIAETTLLPDFTSKSLLLNPTTTIVEVSNTKLMISDSTVASEVSDSNIIISSQLDTTQATEGETDIHSSIISGKKNIAETTLLPDLTSESSNLNPTTNIVNVTKAEPIISDSTDASLKPDSDSLSGSQLHTTQGTEDKTDIYISSISEKDNIAETTLLPDFTGESLSLNPTTNIVEGTDAEPIISDSTVASVVSDSNKIISSQLDTTQATEGETDIHSLIISEKEGIAKTTLFTDLTSESSTLNPTTNLVDVTKTEPIVRDSTDASLKPGSDSLSGSQLHSTQGTEGITDIYISIISEKNNIAETTLLPDFTSKSLLLNPTTTIVEVSNTKLMISDSTVASEVSDSNIIISSQLDTTQATEGETDIHSSIISGKKNIAETTLLPDLTSESSNLNPTTNIVDVTKAEPFISDSTDASLKPDSDSLSGSHLHTTQGTEDKTDIYISSISEKDSIAETTLLPNFTGESLSLNPTTNIVEGTDAEPIISDSTVASVVSDSNKIISIQLDTTQATEGETDIHSSIISEKEGIAKTTLLPDLTSESSVLNPTTNLVDVTKTEPIISDSTDASLKPGSDSLSGSQLHSTQGTEDKTDIYNSIISEKDNIAETTLLPDFTGESLSLNPTTTIVEVSNTKLMISDSTVASVVSDSNKIISSQLDTTQATEGKTDIHSSIISGKKDIAETTLLPDLTSESSNLNPTTNIVDVTKAEPIISDSTDASLKPDSDSLSGSHLHTTQGKEDKTDIYISSISEKDNIAETTLLPDFTDESLSLNPTTNIVEGTDAEPIISNSTVASVVSDSNKIISIQLDTTQVTEGETDIHSSIISEKEGIAKTTLLPNLTSISSTLNPTTNIVDVTKAEPIISDSTDASLKPDSDSLSGSQLHSTQGTEDKTDIYISIISEKDNIAETTLLPDFTGESLSLNSKTTIVEVTNTKPIISDSTVASVVTESNKIISSQLDTTQATEGETDIHSLIISGKKDIAETTLLPDLTSVSSNLNPTTNIVDVTKAEPIISDSTDASLKPDSDSLSGSHLHTTQGKEDKTDIYISSISEKDNIAETTLLPDFTDESLSLNSTTNIVEGTDAEPIISNSTVASVVSDSNKIISIQLDTTQVTEGETDIHSSIISEKEGIAKTTLLPNLTSKSSTLNPTTNIVDVTKAEPIISDSTDASLKPDSDSLSGSQLHSTQGTEDKTDIYISIISKKDNIAETTLLPDFTGESLSLNSKTTIVEVTNTKPIISDSTVASVVSDSNKIISIQLDTTQATEGETDIHSSIISEKEGIAKTTLLPNLTSESSVLNPTTNLVDVTKTELIISDSTDASLKPGSDSLSGSQLHSTQGTEDKTDIHISIISEKDNIAETTLLPDFTGESLSLNSKTTIVEVTNTKPIISDSTVASVVTESNKIISSQLDTTQATEGETDIHSSIISGKKDIAETTLLPDLTSESSNLNPTTNIVDVTKAEPIISDSTDASLKPDSDSLSGSQLHTTQGTEDKTDIYISSISEKDNIAETTLLPDFTGESLSLNPTTNIVEGTDAEPIISDSTVASVVSDSNKIISSQLDTTQATEGETDIHSSIISGKKDIAETTLLPDLTSESSNLNPTTNIVDVTKAEPIISDSTDASLKPDSDSLSGSQLHTTQGTEDKTDIYISSISEKDNIAETTLLPDFTGESLSLNPTTNIVEGTDAEPIISDSTVASVVSDSNKIISSQLDTTQATEGETDIHSSIISGKKDIAETTLLPDLTSESSNLNPTTNIVDVTKAEPIISDSTDASLKPDSDSLSGSQLHSTQGTEDKTDIYISSISEKDNIAETTLLPDFTGESLSLNPTTNIVEGTDAEPIISDSTVASVVSDSNKIISIQLDTTQATEGETDIHSSIISGKEGIAKTTLLPDLTSESSVLNPTTNLVDVTKTEPIISDSTDASLKPGSDSLSGSQLHSTQGTEDKTDIYISIISEKDNIAETTLLPDFTGESLSLNSKTTIVEVTNTKPIISDSTVASVVTESNKIISSQLDTTQATEGETDIHSSIISGKKDIAETTLLPDLTSESSNLNPTTNIVDVTKAEPIISDSTDASLKPDSDSLSGSQLHSTQGTEDKTDIYISSISEKDNIAETTLLPDFTGESLSLNPTTNIVEGTDAEPIISDSTVASVVSDSNKIISIQLDTTQATEGETDIHSSIISEKEGIAKTTLLPDLTSESSVLNPTTNLVDVTKTEPIISDSTDASLKPGSDSLSGSQLHSTQGTEDKTDIYISIISEKDNIAETTLLPDFTGESLSLNSKTTIVEVTNTKPIISDSTVASVVTESNKIISSQLDTTQATEGETDIHSSIISGKKDIAETTLLPDLTSESSNLNPTTNIVDVTKAEPIISDSTDASLKPDSDSLSGSQLHTTQGTEDKTDIYISSISEKDNIAETTLLPDFTGESLSLNPTTNIVEGTDAEPIISDSTVASVVSDSNKIISSQLDTTQATEGETDIHSSIISEKEGIAKTTLLPDLTSESSVLNPTTNLVDVTKTEPIISDSTDASLKPGSDSLSGSQLHSTQGTEDKTDIYISIISEKDNIAETTLLPDFTGESLSLNSKTTIVEVTNTKPIISDSTVASVVSDSNKIISIQLDTTQATEGETDIHSSIISEKEGIAKTTLLPNLTSESSVLNPTTNLVDVTKTELIISDSTDASLKPGSDSLSGSQLHSTQGTEDKTDIHISIISEKDNIAETTLLPDFTGESLSLNSKTTIVEVTNTKPIISDSTVASVVTESNKIISSQLDTTQATEGETDIHSSIISGKKDIAETTLLPDLTSESSNLNPTTNIVDVTKAEPIISDSTDASLKPDSDSLSGSQLHTTQGTEDKTDIYISSISEKDNIAETTLLPDFTGESLSLNPTTNIVEGTDAEPIISDSTVASVVSDSNKIISSQLDTTQATEGETDIHSSIISGKKDIAETTLLPDLTSESSNLNPTTNIVDVTKAEPIISDSTDASLKPDSDSLSGSQLHTTQGTEDKTDIYISSISEKDNIAETTLLPDFTGESLSLNPTTNIVEGTDAEPIISDSTVASVVSDSNKIISSQLDTTQATEGETDIHSSIISGKKDIAETTLLPDLTSESSNLNPTTNIVDVTKAEPIISDSTDASLKPDSDSLSGSQLHSTQGTEDKTDIYISSISEKDNIAETTLLPDFTGESLSLNPTTNIVEGTDAEPIISDSTVASVVSDSNKIISIQLDTTQATEGETDIHSSIISGKEGIAKTTLLPDLTSEFSVLNPTTNLVDVTKTEPIISDSTDASLKPGSDSLSGSQLHSTQGTEDKTDIYISIISEKDNIAETTLLPDFTGESLSLNSKTTIVEVTNTKPIISDSTVASVVTESNKIISSQLDTTQATEGETDIHSSIISGKKDIAETTLLPDLTSESSNLNPTTNIVDVTKAEPIISDSTDASLKPDSDSLSGSQLHSTQGTEDKTDIYISSISEKDNIAETTLLPDFTGESLSLNPTTNIVKGTDAEPIISDSTVASVVSDSNKIISIQLDTTQATEGETDIHSSIISEKEGIAKTTLLPDLTSESSVLNPTTNLVDVTKTEPIISDSTDASLKPGSDSLSGSQLHSTQGTEDKTDIYISIISEKDNIAKTTLLPDFTGEWLSLNSKTTIVEVTNTKPIISDSTVASVVTESNKIISSQLDTTQATEGETDIHSSIISGKKDIAETTLLPDLTSESSNLNPTTNIVDVTKAEPIISDSTDASLKPDSDSLSGSQLHTTQGTEDKTDIYISSISEKDNIAETTLLPDFTGESLSLNPTTNIVEGTDAVPIISDSTVASVVSDSNKIISSQLDTTQATEGETDIHSSIISEKEGIAKTTLLPDLTSESSVLNPTTNLVDVTKTEPIISDSTDASLKPGSDSLSGSQLHSTQGTEDKTDIYISIISEKDNIAKTTLLPDFTGESLSLNSKTTIVEVTNTKPIISDSTVASVVTESNKIISSQLDTTQATEGETDIHSSIISGKKDIAETTLLPDLTSESSNLNPTTNIVDVTKAEPIISDSTDASLKPDSDSLSGSQLHSTQGTEDKTDIYISSISEKDNIAETTLLPDFTGESLSLNPTTNIVEGTDAEPIISDSTVASVVSDSNKIISIQLDTTQATEGETDIHSSIISEKEGIAKTTLLPDLTSESSVLNPTTNLVDVTKTEPIISDSTDASLKPGSDSLSGSQLHSTQGTEDKTDIYISIISEKDNIAKTTLLPDFTGESLSLNSKTTIVEVTNTKPIISDSTVASVVTESNKIISSQLDTTQATEGETDIHSSIISGKKDIAETTLLPDLTSESSNLNPTTNIVDVTKAEPIISDSTDASLKPDSDSLSGSQLHTTQGTEDKTDIYISSISEKDNIAETTLLPDFTGESLSLNPTTNIVEGTDAEPIISDSTVASVVSDSNKIISSQLDTTQATEGETDIHSSIISEKEGIAKTTLLPDLTSESSVLNPTTNLVDVTKTEPIISDSTDASLKPGSDSLSGSQLHSTQGTEDKTDIYISIISEKDNIAETTLLPDFTGESLSLNSKTTIVEVTNTKPIISDSTVASVVTESNKIISSQLDTTQATEGETDIHSSIISGKKDIAETTLLPDLTSESSNLNPTTNIVDVTKAEPIISDSTDASLKPDSDSLSGSQLHSTQGTEDKTDIYISSISEKDNIAETTLLPDFTGDSLSLNPTTNIVEGTDAEPIISDSTVASVVSDSNKIISIQLDTTQATEGETDIHSSIISEKEGIAKTTLLPDFSSESSTLNPTTNLVDVTKTEPIINDSTDASLKPGSDSLSGSQLHSTQGTEDKTDIYISIISEKDNIAETTLLPDFTGDSISLNPTTIIVEGTDAEPIISDSTVASVVSDSNNIISSQLDTTQATEGETDIYSSIISRKKDIAETTLLPDLTSGSSTLNPTTNIVDVTKAEPQVSDSSDTSVVYGTDSFSGSQFHTTHGTVDKTDGLNINMSEKEDIAVTSLLPDFTGESSTLKLTTSFLDTTNAEPIISFSTDAALESDSNSFSGSQKHTTQGTTDIKTDILSSIILGNEDIVETSLLPVFSGLSSSSNPTSNIVDMTNADIISSASPGLSLASVQISQLSTQPLSTQDLWSSVVNIKTPEVSLRTCNVTIKCNSHSMHVSIRDIELDSASLSSLSLNSTDPKCHPFFNGSHYVFVVPLFDCGTIRRYINFAVVYSNVITDSIISGNLISRSKKNIPFSCVYPTESRVSPVSFQVNDIASQLIGEQLGFGKFEININIYHDSSFSHLLQTNDYPMEIDDRLYFEVKLESNDNLLILSVENCFITPSSDKNDSRKHFLLKDGCKEDETLVKHSSPPGSQRMSYESFSFVGVESSLTYLHCDVFVCDSRVSDTHCSKDKCIRGRKRRHLNNINNLESFNTFQVKSGPIFVDNRHSVYKAELNESIKESKALRSYYNMQKHSSNLIVLISLVVAVCVLTLPFVILNRRFNNKYDAGLLP